MAAAAAPRDAAPQSVNLDRLPRQQLAGQGLQARAAAIVRQAAAQLCRGQQGLPGEAQLALQAREAGGSEGRGVVSSGAASANGMPLLIHSAQWS